jgi:hypothetical protein
MRKFRLIIAGISAALIVVTLFFINYQDLMSKSNLGSFLGITGMLFNILAMILSNRHDAKNQPIPNYNSLSYHNDRKKLARKPDTDN